MPIEDLTVCLTTATAAKKLGVGETYVRRLLKAGKLKGIQVGRMWLVDPESVGSFRPARRGRPARSK